MIERYIHYDVPGLIKEYDENRETLRSLRENLAEVEGMDSSCSAPASGRVQSSHMGGGAVNVVILIDALRRKIESYEKGIAWYDGAWARLSEEDQIILEEFYQRGYINRKDAIDRLVVLLGYERTVIYAKRKEAINHFNILLFG